ncbi:uncharacterized protein LOC117006199 [Catharus ustulatus]|uniref:uncharacterized protein LOC117006199 n=1 Tax=Catharus ustulatus TaxID=91951 RepID=UPI00140B6FE7|nr:uncharacterized protein LOC117006199 [Catharus ustulatus]
MEAPGSAQGPKAELSQRHQEMRALVGLQGAASGCLGTGASQPPRPARYHRYNLPDVPQSKAGKIFTQSCEEKLRQNRELLPTLQAALQEDSNILKFVLKHNKLPIKDAFGEGQELVSATESLEPGKWCHAHQVVIKKIEAKVHEQVKVCDMLLHQLRQWSQARDERQRRLQELQDAEMDPKWQEPQLQTIRQLGNDIEKMLMKIRSGEIVTNLYLRLQEVLRRVSLSSLGTVSLALPAEAQGAQGAVSQGTPC